jgi:hypothetical protein
LQGARKVDVREKRAELVGLVCAVESEKRANGGTSETWGWSVWFISFVLFVWLLSFFGLRTK